MLRIFLRILLVLVFVLGITVGYFNVGLVRVHYLFGQIELPLIAVLVAVFIAASLVTLLFVSARVLSLRSEIRRLQRELREAETELKSLRNLPLSADGAR